MLHGFWPREESIRWHMHSNTQMSNSSPYWCISHLLEMQARRIPNAPALLAPGRAPLTYERLWGHTGTVVQTLNTMGVGRGDRVALVLPDGPEMAAAFVCVAAGATCAPLNPDSSAHEFALYLTDLCPKALILHAGMESPARAVAQAQGVCILELSPVPEAEAGRFRLTGEAQPRAMSHGCAQADDVALVVYSTGTTAHPKQVPLTHTNLCTSAHDTRVALALGEDDRCLNVMPLFHIHGLHTALFTSLVAGASVVCTQGFAAAQFFTWMAEFRPTWYTAVPTIHQTILAYAPMHRAIIAGCPLRFIRSASAALPPRVLTELEQVFGAPVLEGYGLTETTAQVTCNPLPPQPRKVGSVGVAAGPQVAIMDERGTLLPAGEIGEVVVRGASVMQGYVDAEANRQSFTQGWLRTGDQGFLDPEGYLFITGRFKEIINRGGEKIAPREVDDVLMEHPAVAQAVAFAMPDVRLGEDIAAAVVLHKHISATESDLRQYAATRLAAFKVPRRVLVVEDLPRGPIGKLQRLDMAEKLGLTTAQAQPSTRADGTSPRTPVEEVLAGIWVQVLDLKRVSVHADFFWLGGNSLLATQMLSRVRDAFRVGLPLRSLFETPTIAMLAEHVETALWTMGNLQKPSATVGDNREDIEF